MADDLTRIPILKRPPVQKLWLSHMSDEDQPVFVEMTLGLEYVDELPSGFYSKRELILIERLHHNRRQGIMVFSGAAYRKERGQWRKHYSCAGRIFLRNGESRQAGWLVDTEKLFTDCTDSPLPAIRWRQAMQEANNLMQDLVGDHFLGEEVVRRTVNILSEGMLRRPSACSKCGAEVQVSEWGSQAANCPNCGPLDDGEDLMVYAIPRFRRQPA
jgi:predicted Zn-ribbon and HTH transcriptional regulator